MANEGAAPSIAIGVPGDLLGTLDRAQVAAKNATKQCIALEKAQIAGLKKGKEFDQQLDANLKKARQLEMQANKAVAAHKNAIKSNQMAVAQQQQTVIANRARAHTQKEAFKAAQGLGGSAMAGNYAAMFSRGGVKDMADIAELAGDAALAGGLNRFAPHIAILTAGASEIYNQYQKEKEYQRRVRTLATGGRVSAERAAWMQNGVGLKGLFNPVNYATGDVWKAVFEDREGVVNQSLNAAKTGFNKLDAGRLRKAFERAPINRPFQDSMVEGYISERIKTAETSETARRMAGELRRDYDEELRIAKRGGPLTKADEQRVKDKAMERFTNRYTALMLQNPDWAKQFEKASDDILNDVAPEREKRTLQYAVPKRPNDGRRFDNYAKSLKTAPITHFQEAMESRQLAPMSNPTAPTALSPRSAFKLQSGIRMNRAKSSEDDE